MVYDILVMNKWKEKGGDEKTAFRAVGTAFDAKAGAGGLNCEPYGGVAITGPFIIRKRKAGGGGSGKAVDNGEDFLE